MSKAGYELESVWNRRDLNQRNAACNDQVPQQSDVQIQRRYAGVNLRLSYRQQRVDFSEKVITYPRHFPTPARCRCITGRPDSSSTRTLASSSRKVMLSP